MIRRLPIILLRIPLSSLSLPSSAVLKGLHWQKTLGTDLQQAKKAGKRQEWSEREGARVSGLYTSTLLTGETISFPPLLLGADLIERV